MLFLMTKNQNNHKPAKMEQLPRLNFHSTPQTDGREKRVFEFVMEKRPKMDWVFKQSYMYGSSS
jgi:hypothetical protein